MRSRNAAAAIVLGGLSLLAIQARAAAAISLAPQPRHHRVVSGGSIEPIYWEYRGGVRVWIGPPPAPYYQRGYYGRPPYWYHGRGYYHRRWYHGGWRYW